MVLCRNFVGQCKIAYTSGTKGFFCILVPLQTKPELVPFFANASSVAIFYLAFLSSICPKIIQSHIFLNDCNYLWLSKFTKNINWLISLNPRFPQNPKWPTVCVKWCVELRTCISFSFPNDFYCCCLWEFTETTNNLI